MPSVELIAVGTELLLGQLVDTNTASRRFAARYDRHRRSCDACASAIIADRIAAVIAGVLERARRGRYDGRALDPPSTMSRKRRSATRSGSDTVLDQPSLEFMEAIFQIVRARDAREQSQAGGAAARGASVGRIRTGRRRASSRFERDGRFVACMPGVPREMKPMLDDQLIPFLRERFDLRDAIYTRVIHTINLGESEIDHRIDDLFRTSENPKIAVLAHDFRARRQDHGEGGVRRSGGGRDRAVAARDRGAARGIRVRSRRCDAGKRGARRARSARVGRSRRPSRAPAVALRRR